MTGSVAAAAPPSTLTCPRCGRDARRARPRRSAPAAGTPLRARERHRRSAEPARRRRSAAGSACCSSTLSAPPRSPSGPTRRPVRALQTDFFATVRRVVRQYGGVVEKYIGDAAMALFGAPVATETDAVRCVRAGLDLQRAAGPATRRPAHAGWTFRVGIATGEALVDVAAAHDGGQAIVAGDVVNTAARLQAEAPPGGVLVCGTTHAATRTEIRYAAQPPVTLRGRSTPTEVWLALAPVQRSRLDRDSTRPRWSAATTSWGCWQAPCTTSIRERMPQLVTMLGPRRHRQEPPGARAVPARPAARRRAGSAGAAAAARRSARTSPTPRWPTSSRRRPASWPPTPPEAARAPARRGAAATWCRPGESAPALRRAAPAGRPARLAAVHRGRRVGLAAVPARAGRARPDRARLRGPALGRRRGCCASSSCSARPSGTCRCCVVCTARPELVDREPSWAGARARHARRSRCTPLRDDSIATLYAQHVRPGRVPARAAAARWSSWPTACRSTPTSTRGCWSSGARCASPTRLVDGAQRRPADAGERARGHRQPDRPARRGGPGGAAGRRRGGHAVLARRGRGRAGHRRRRGRAGAAHAGAARPGPRAAGLDDGRRAGVPVPARAGQRRLLRAAAAGRADRPARAHRRLARRADSTAAAPSWPRWWPTTGSPPTRSRARSAWTPRPYAGAGAGGAAPGRPAGGDAATPSTPPPPTSRRASQLVARHRPPERRPAVGQAPTASASCSAPRLAFHRDRPASSTGAGPDRLTELADPAVPGRRPRRRRPGVDAARPDRLAARRPAAARCAAWTARWSCSTRCRTRRRRPRPTPSWAGCTCSTTSTTPALGATQIAAEIAERLGLVELRANALITIGMLPLPGRRAATGWSSCSEALEFCRTYQLPSLRRATQNVAYALREEGERDRSDQVLTRAADRGWRPRRRSLLRRDAGPVRRGLGPVPHRGRRVPGQPCDAAEPANVVASATPAEPTNVASGPADPSGRGWLRALRGDAAAAAEDTARSADRGPGERLLAAALDGAGPRRAVPGRARTSTPTPTRCCASWPRAGAGCAPSPAASGSPRPRTPPPPGVGRRDAAGCRSCAMLWRCAAPHAVVAGGAALDRRRAGRGRRATTPPPRAAPRRRGAATRTIGSATDRMLALGSAAAGSRPPVTWSPTRPSAPS